MSLKCSVPFLCNTTQHNNGHEANTVRYAMLKILEKNKVHFTRNLKNTTTHTRQYSVLDADYFVVMTMESPVWFVFFNTVCMSVLPCVCSIDRTFMPYKKCVPQQSILTVCIVSSSYQRMLSDLSIPFIFIFLHKH
jgi:hypothetical protein